jgi:hypothetical protein
VPLVCCGEESSNFDVANGLQFMAVMLEKSEGGRFFLVELGKLDMLDMLSLPTVGLVS